MKSSSGSFRNGRQRKLTACSGPWAALSAARSACAVLRSASSFWTTGGSHVSDTAWQFVEYAVPAGLADGQAKVYFRWGLGPTDDFVTCPGWNIDDVQVTGARSAN